MYLYFFFHFNITGLCFGMLKEKTLNNWETGKYGYFWNTLKQFDYSIWNHGKITIFYAFYNNLNNVTINYN